MRVIHSALIAVISSGFAVSLPIRPVSNKIIAAELHATSPLCPTYVDCSSCLSAPPPPTGDNTPQRCVWSPSGFISGNHCEPTGWIEWKGEQKYGVQTCSTNSTAANTTAATIPRTEAPTTAKPTPTPYYIKPIPISRQQIMNYCTNKYTYSVDFTSTQTNYFCTIRPPIDLNEACRQQYNPASYAVNTNGNDPYSYQCVRPSSNYNHLSLDMVAYCKKYGYGDAWVKNTVDSWFCHYNAPDHAISESEMNTVCSQQHPGSVARYGDYNDPKSWFCSMQYTIDGDISLDNYCYNKFNTNAATAIYNDLIGMGGVKKLNIDNQWYCQGYYEFTMKMLCEYTNSTYMFASYKDGSGTATCCFTPGRCSKWL